MNAASPVVERVLAALRARDCEPQQNGTGWSARCPSHQDNRASLAIGTGAEGRVLLHCHAGCSAEAVVAELGLKLSDLFNGPSATAGRRKAAPPPRPPPPPSQKPPPVDCAAEAEQFVQAMTPALAAELADLLGIPVDVLAELSVGWCAARSAWSFPERDFTGRVIGIMFRDRDGAKLAGAGHKRGLTVPKSLPSLPDSVLVVEGSSDVAAALAMGLAAVGRPAAAAGADLVGELLRGREVLVVGERDEKNGKWPGRDGARTVAQALAKSWDQPVAWTLPPEGAKDLRTWFNAEDVHGPEACAEAGRRLLEALQAAAETVEPDPPYASDQESRKAVDAMADTARGITQGGRSLADQACEWLDRRGPELLGPSLPSRQPRSMFAKPLTPEARAVVYAARACGIKSTAAFYRLGKIGRVRRLLRREVRARTSMRARTIDGLSDRTVGPFLRLLDTRPGDIGAAFQEAETAAASEGRAVNGRHVQAVVDRLDPPKGRRKALRKLVGAAYRRAHKETDAPLELVALLERADQVAAAWAAQGQVK